MLQQNPDGSWSEGVMHGWFGLTYASYLVMPRMVIQEMPLEWQEKFRALLIEWGAFCEAKGIPYELLDRFVVMDRGDRGLLQSPVWNNYRRGSIKQVLSASGALVRGHEQA